MLEVKVYVPASASSDTVRNVFVAMARSSGLDGSEMTLKKYPGCIHWHLHKPGHKGTLEATWWPEERRFWFSVHANRRAEWQGQMIGAVEVVLAEC